MANTALVTGNAAVNGPGKVLLSQTWYGDDIPWYLEYGWVYSMRDTMASLWYKPLCMDSKQFSLLIASLNKTAQNLQLFKFFLYN